MIKIKLGIRHLNGTSKAEEFTVYLKFTDGIEPILVTTDFDEVLAKIKAVQEAIPQTTNYDVELM